MVFPEHVRRRIYLVCAPLIALLAGYGLIAESMVPLWVAFLTALFGTGLAAANTPPKKTPPPAE